MNIFDFRHTIRTTDDVFSVMTLIMSVLQTRPDLQDEPFVFILNEAHDYFKKGNLSGEFVQSIEHLIRRKRHSSNWLLLDTHFPDDVDDKVVKLSDVKILHYMDKTVNTPILRDAFDNRSREASQLATGQALVSADKSSLGLSKVIKLDVRPRLTKHGGATKTASR